MRRRAIFLCLVFFVVTACESVQQYDGPIGRDCDRVRKRVDRLETRIEEYERQASDSRGPPGSPSLEVREREHLRQLENLLREVRSRLCH